ncbi:MAG: DUF4421 family protein [Bacteroidia bacterium]
MRLIITCILTGVIAPGLCAQAVADSTYVKAFPQNFSATLFVARNSIEVNRGETVYSPNNPVNIGAGISVKNTVVNLKYAFSIPSMAGKNQGRTESGNFQLHNYRRYLVTDFFYQYYKGFYTGDKEVMLYPNLTVTQTGLQMAYIVKGNRFSAKAAFEQSEIQVKSAGSLVWGTNVFYTEANSGEDDWFNGKTSIKNLQMGISAGYGYNKVIAKQWLLSGILTAGPNFGNSPDMLKKGHIKLYPAVSFQASGGYHEKDWSIYASFIIHTKNLTTTAQTPTQLTSINTQLSLIRRFNLNWRNKA